MGVPKIIQDLVTRFETHRESYTSLTYNETQLRREFLDPFFEALGWDVNNAQGIAEAYKDVIHEDAIKIGGFTKAPDYCFRIGGSRKFFIEAKKPAVNLKSDVSPAFQLRRYAWSAKLPISILSDFEEFVVYDTRIKPRKSDPASKGRVQYFKYTEYLERWDEIESIFSREAILKGNFDKFTEKARLKKGTEEVNDEFLKEIEKWREHLAKDLAQNNSLLTTRELNFSVQHIIDRIIFLRICEDRGIENYGQLMALQNGSVVYGRLCELFDRADERYNSGLFHFREEKEIAEAPDTLTQQLKVSDGVLKDIFKHLYYPDSPYEFSVLPADILGQVYEQFLGKIIRLTSSHHAVVEEKPEVKKAGGVYYTPTYIVNYIVQQTVGKLLEGKNPVQAAKLKILDPACGSGSFLIGAYQCLLNWHLDWYVAQGPEKYITGKSPILYQGRSSEWRLTSREKKRILLNNIYGVDIDSQAVEVTKLSLSLKVLEGESEEAITKQLQFFRERALPDLGKNIKCGNSLIGPDFYEGQQMSFLDEEEKYRINVFNWNTEFSGIMKNGGFDAVIGNPPYIFTREQISEAERKYFSKHYKLGWEKQNTYMLFMELLLRILKESGNGGFIVPNSWLTIESGRLLRGKYINRLSLVADLNYAVFDRVSMEPCIFIVSGKDNKDDVTIVRSKSKEDFLSASPSTIKRDVWRDAESRIVLTSSKVTLQLLAKIQANSCQVGSKFDVRTGLQAYEEGKGNPPQTKKDVQEHIFDRKHCEDRNSIRYLQGRDASRYFVSWSGLWMQYGQWLAQPREIGIFTRPRVLLREITSPPPYCLYATFVDEQYLNNKSILNILHPDDLIDELKILTCVLNSRLMSFFYKNHAVKSARTIFPKVVIKNLREFPFPRSIKKEILRKLLSFSDAMLLLHRRKVATKTSQEKISIERQTAATDNQIDRLIYELYGLTADEIQIVEKI